MASKIKSLSCKAILIDALRNHSWEISTEPISDDDALAAKLHLFQEHMKIAFRTGASEWRYESIYTSAIHVLILRGKFSQCTAVFGMSASTWNM